MKNTPENYEILLEELLSPGEWFQISRSLFLVMKLDEAVFLSYLMGVSRSVKAHEKNEGWFYHTWKQVEEELYQSRRVQDSLVRDLKKMGFIQMELRGLPAKRWFKIEYRYLRDTILEARKARIFPVAPKRCNKLHENGATDCTETVQQRRSRISASLEEEEINEPRWRSALISLFSFDPDVHTIKWQLSYGKLLKQFALDQNKHTPEWQRSFVLYKILHRCKKVVQQLKSLKDWSKSFVELAKARTWEEIDIALAWYAQHFGEEYTPIAYDAKTFVKKFAMYEDAVQRSQVKPRFKNNGQQSNVKVEQIESSNGRRTMRMTIQEDQS